MRERKNEWKLKRQSEKNKQKFTGTAFQGQQNKTEKWLDNLKVQNSGK